MGIRFIMYLAAIEWRGRQDWAENQEKNQQIAQKRSKRFENMRATLFSIMKGTIWNKQRKAIMVYLQ